MTGKKNPPKLSMEHANMVRAKYLGRVSINTLCKQYGLSRHSIKCILKGITYNRDGEYKNLMEKEKTSLF